MTKENIAVILNEIDHMKESIAKTEKSLEKIDGKLDGLMEALDSRYASKNVERIVYGMVWFVLVAFMGALVALVIHK